MPDPDVPLRPSRWFKSSRSNGCGHCVEARIEQAAVVIRDSKYRRDLANASVNEPTITVSFDGWRCFVAEAIGEVAASSTQEIMIERDHDASGMISLVSVEDGTRLSFTPDEWAAFIAGIHVGDFRLPEATLV